MAGEVLARGRRISSLRKMADEPEKVVPDPAEEPAEIGTRVLADLGLIVRPAVKYFPPGLLDLYESFEYRHASALLANEFPAEFKDICEALGEFRFTDEQIKAPGGNESDIPKTISNVMR